MDLRRQAPRLQDQSLLVQARQNLPALVNLVKSLPLSNSFRNGQLKLLQSMMLKTRIKLRNLLLLSQHQSQRQQQSLQLSQCQSLRLLSNNLRHQSKSPQKKLSSMMYRQWLMPNSKAWKVSMPTWLGPIVILLSKRSSNLSLSSTRLRNLLRRLKKAVNRLS